MSGSQRAADGRVKHFSQPFPARTTIGVAALPLAACVEIDLVVKA
jgi:enamine deaminase RidA (YjgF/YER057c/UK114 family)